MQRTHPSPIIPHFHSHQEADLLEVDIHLDNERSLKRPVFSPYFLLSGTRRSHGSILQRVREFNHNCSKFRERALQKYFAFAVGNCVVVFKESSYYGERGRLSGRNPGLLGLHSAKRSLTMDRISIFQKKREIEILGD
jgi:hypothetical protein